jgi:hypothetical protein
MKWSTFSEEFVNQITQEQISEFESSLVKQLKILSNSIPKNYNIKIPKFSSDILQRIKTQDFKRNKEEHIYDWYHYCFTPVSVMQSYRVSRLKYLHQTLKRMIKSYEESQLHEFCFSFRLFIEVAASYNHGTNQILNSSEFIINFKKPPIKGTLEERKDYLEKVMQPNQEFMNSGVVKLFTQLGNIVMPTKINLQGKSNGFNDNKPLKPKESELGSYIISKSITKSLISFEKEIKNLRPFYDLLCEFLHPNSYILMSIMENDPSEQFAIKMSNELDDEAETIKEFFIRIESHNFIENLIKDTLDTDKKMKKNIIEYKKSIKTIVNSTLGLVPTHKYKPFIKIAAHECLCGSKKKILDCCIKTSKRDQKLLEHHGNNLINQKKFLH